MTNGVWPEGVAEMSALKLGYGVPFHLPHRRQVREARFHAGSSRLGESSLSSSGLADRTIAIPRASDYSSFLEPVNLDPRADFVALWVCKQGPLSDNSMLNLCQILDWEILSGPHGHRRRRTRSSPKCCRNRIDAPDAVNWIKAREFASNQHLSGATKPGGAGCAIEQLAARNAAGLGVKLTRFLREFPENARRRADELGLPIISLPGALAWSDLISKVFADGGQQRSRAAHLSVVYRGFSQHRARIGSLRELFDLVTGFVNLPIVLAMEDQTGLRIESRGVSHAEAERLAER